ncbi:histidine phosphatase family protein [Niallia sp. Krafla_26]|uniref:histidine phosphatase family protein n=1 Tax=Niallia sp. Krafla_26 TaxID=3064703 RepID=UPI003D165749
MLTLYIVRHGETEWNKEGRIQGRLNSSLTENGRQVARLLGERLRDVDFFRVISSPSERTRETTELIIGDRGLLYETADGIMEMDMGPWQGLLMDEIRKRYADQYDCFRNRPEDYLNEEAESFIDMYKRAEKFLSTLLESGDTGNLLVVSHGLFIKSLFLVIKGIPINDFWTIPTVDGASLSVVQIEQGLMKVVLEGDISHVRDKSIG